MKGDGASMKRNHKRFILALLASGLLFIGPPGWSQQPKPKTQKPPAQPVQQEQEEYTDEEYDAYDKAVNEPDLDKRGTMLLAFMEKYPKSKLKTYIVTAYQTLMYEYQKSQKYAKLEPLAEQWLKYYPDDLQTMAYIAESAQMLGQDKKFLDYGLKIYEQKPSAKLAGYISQSYEKVGDKDKYLEWTQKLFTYPEYDGNFGIRMIFVKKYADEKNLDKAAQYANLALKCLDVAKKQDAQSDADFQKEKATVRRYCYFILGLNLYEKDKYAESIKNLEMALKAERFDAAYYYIGQDLWRLEKVEDAILAFAKAVILKGDTSAQAKEHLEKLYKGLHNNTLIGIEKVYRRAESELGL
jgi:tetratricopeptide (TPR) repeat protein